MLMISARPLSISKLRHPLLLFIRGLPFLAVRTLLVACFCVKWDGISDINVDETTTTMVRLRIAEIDAQESLLQLAMKELSDSRLF
jgi:hypothetical protein